MRAGCFAETRVIRLVNRRFINFFYNTGGPGQGKDERAAAFTKGKTKNTYAFYAAFDAAGEPLGVTDVYANKDNTFDWLVELLRNNPEFDKYTEAEEKVLAKAKAEPKDAAARLAAGQLMEDLGKYKEADGHYRAVLEISRVQTEAGDAYRGLLRMARYARDWKGVRAVCGSVNEMKEGQINKLNLAPDVAMESAYAFLAEKKYDDARKLLAGAIEKFPDSTRLSEFHFSAGVANFFLKEKEWAYYHWCWVVENLPDDRLARRCFTAAAHEAMPYENPELGGYAADLRGGNIELINAEYKKAKAVYEKVKKVK
jgi:tetratricopeptide (TPR) repeat protein